LRFISKHRNIFANLSFPFDEVQGWLKADISTTLKKVGASKELIDEFLLLIDNQVLSTLKKENGDFDFFKLLFGNNPKDTDFANWVNTVLTWYRAIPLKWLKRNWFKDELYW